MALFSGGLYSAVANASGEHCQTYALADINSIDVEAFAAIDIRQGDVNELTVSASDSFIEHLQIQIVDSKAVIRDRRPQGYWLQQRQFLNHLTNPQKSPSNIHFLLTLKNPESIVLSGYLATKVHRIDSPNMAITFTGSGSLNLHHLQHKHLQVVANGHIKTMLRKVDADRADLTVNGNGKVAVEHVDFEQLTFLMNGMHHCQLEGKARNVLINMKGNGTCSGQDFIARQALIGLQGNSELILEVDKYLQATTLDTSRVRYYGKPKVNTTGEAADVTRLASGTPTRMYF